MKNLIHTISQQTRITIVELVHRWPLADPEKVRYKVIGVEMKGMESSMKLVALGATQRKG